MIEKYSEDCLKKFLEKTKKEVAADKDAGYT
jgi:hypothetical protein